MKLAVFILVAALAGLAYKYHQEAVIAQNALEAANSQLQQYRQTADAPNPLERQVMVLQQQLAAVRQPVAAPRFQTAGAAPTAAPTVASTALHGTALDEPAQPTSSHVNAPVKRGR